jgi:hypothetical protein
MDKNSKLIEIIKELVKQELEEITTTASAGGQYMTPHAFSKKKLKKKKAGYGGGHEDPNIGGSYILAKDSKLRGGAVGKGGVTHHKKINRPSGKINESVKMHTISGNKRFMTKTAIPILKKYGIKNMKAHNIGGYFLELRFPIDSRKLKDLDKELKRKNKRAYGGIVEGRYHQWRNDDSKTPKQKIGMAMRETRDNLTELERMVNYNVKLKNELKVDSRDYWKNTHKALSKISERLVRLANKVGQLH